MLIQARPKCVDSREPIKRGMWLLAGLECYPILGDTLGLETISDFFVIVRFLFQEVPQPLDKDVDPLPGSRFAETKIGEVTTPPIHRYTHARIGQRCDPG